MAQYGPSVLGRPPAHGFNLTVYILPPALVLIGVASLAFTLAEVAPALHARRQRTRRLGPGLRPSCLPEDARRLEDEQLVRHQ